MASHPGKTGTGRLTPAAAYQQVLANVDQAIANAIEKNKVDRWGYYLAMRGRLVAVLAPGGGRPSDTQVVLRCRQAVAEAADRCPRLASLDPEGTARLWCLSVYCTDILRLSGHTVNAKLRRLDWLHARAADLHEGRAPAMTPAA